MPNHELFLEPSPIGHAGRSRAMTLPGTGGRIKIWGDLRLDNLAILFALIAGIFYAGQFAQRWLDQQNDLAQSIVTLNAEMADSRKQEQADRVELIGRIDSGNASAARQFNAIDSRLNEMRGELEDMRRELSSFPRSPQAAPLPRAPVVQP
jgi:hypothetical protein